MQEVKWTANHMAKSGDAWFSVMEEKQVEVARAFHRSFPQYTVTPLQKLEMLAHRLGVGGVFVKDESYRFGLNAFKVLGSSFAMARYIAKETGRGIETTNYDYLIGDELAKEFGKATFFTATDGNHGRGVAWAAGRLGQNAVVYMPKGSARARFDNILKEGAAVTIEDANYDECVRKAAAAAANTPCGVVVQDTAWEGYEEIPSWIMQGYGTMALEALEQLGAAGVERPTHIFVQAGVGSLAGAMVGFFANMFPENPPVCAIMEAQAADCLYRSALAGDGTLCVVDGDLDTIMAGLACGEANTISWDILRNHASVFISCPDSVAAKGMRMLSAPLRGDPQVISGESGAVGVGLLTALVENDDYEELRGALRLTKDSKVLLFSTEGDTDPQSYRDIVWNGACPSTSSQ